MATERDTWQANLERLTGELQTHARAHGAPVQVPPEVSALSESLYLSHGSTSAAFAAVCKSGWLRSAWKLDQMGLRPLDPACDEAVLGTANSVFFFVSPFGYPKSVAGLLFRADLESEAEESGSASPFDSGGLIKHIRRPNPDEPAVDFLGRHQLPLPKHREYLAQTISSLFAKPADYVTGVDPILAGPLGLEGGNYRRWTHEVRMPESVAVRHSPHLEAVFSTLADAARRETRPLFEWCVEAGVEIVTFDAPREGAFEALRRECLEYMRRRGIY